MNAGVNSGYGFRPLENVYVYGNTFLNGSYWLDPSSSGDAYPLLKLIPYSGDTTYGSQDVNVRVMDNIFTTYAAGRATGAIELTGADPGFSSNNNLFNLPNVSGGTFMKQSGTAMTLAAWRTATGNDVNSVTGDPKFTGGTLTELNTMVPGTPSSQDACIAEANSLISTLPLAADSPAIEAGANLGAALFYDFGLNIRPADGDGDGTAQTDIGAFEFIP